jgi:glycosyltransferase involved in cell wall biosynthesis
MARETFVEVVPNFPLVHMPPSEDYFQIPLEVARNLGMETLVLADRQYLKTSDLTYRKWPVEWHQGPWRVLRRMRKARPALVHGQSLYLAAYLAPATTRAPCVFTPHGLMDDPLMPLRSRLQRVERLAGPVFLRLFRKILCVSPHEVEGYRKRGFSRTELLPNPIDHLYLSRAGPADARAFRRRHRIDSEFVLAHVSTMYEIKNPAVIVRAHQLLRERGYDTTLVMAGPDHFRSAHAREEFEKACREAGNVVLPGKLDFPRVREVLAAADAFVVSSDWETQCIAAFEAAAAGVPLFLSDIPTLRGAFGRLAAYHPARDADALSRNLKAFLEGKARGARPAELKAFARRFGVPEYKRRLRGIYEELLRR